MMQNDLLSKLRTYITEKAKITALGGDENIIEANYLDSLGLVEFMSWLESEFKITVSEEDFSEENFRTIKTIANFVRSKL